MQPKKAQKVSIRLARPEDSRDIVRLQLNSLNVLSAKDYSASQLQALLDNKKCPRSLDETIFVAEIDSTIVGFASLVKSHNLIGAVFVHPHFIRQGIGTKLLKVVESAAINNKIRVLWVSSSITGHAFYRANGYQTLRKVNIGQNWLVPIPCIKMKKRLFKLSKQEKTLDLVCNVFIGFVVAILATSLFL